MPEREFVVRERTGEVMEILCREPDSIAVRHQIGTIQCDDAAEGSTYVPYDPAKHGEIRFYG